MTYRKKFLIRIETIFLSFKQFQSYDIYYSIKSSSKIKNLEEKNLKNFKNIYFWEHPSSHLFINKLNFCEMGITFTT